MSVTALLLVVDNLAINLLLVTTLIDQHTLATLSKEPKVT